MRSSIVCYISFEMYVPNKSGSAKVILTSRQGTASQRFISHGVRLLATILTTYDIVGALLQTEVDLLIAGGLVDCLLNFLRGLYLSDPRRKIMC